MATGLLFVFITAIVWVVLGAVVSNAAQKNLNLGFIQGAGAIFIALLTLPIYFLKDLHVPLAVWISISISGWGNYVTFILMNKAMQKGPNGLVWAMVQSAFAMPFLMGILFFQVPCSVTRIIGIIILIAAMILMGIFGKKNEPGEKKPFIWIFFAVIAYISAGITQSTANLPSYLLTEDSAGIWTALFRSGISSFGIFTAFVVHGLINRTVFNGKGCGKLTFLMTVSTIMSLLFAFLALDRMAACNAGAIAYPMIVGISIVAFMVYTAIKLKERPALAALLSLMLCLAGIVIIAL